MRPGACQADLPSNHGADGGHLRGGGGERPGVRGKWSTLPLWLHLQHQHLPEEGEAEDGSDERGLMLASGSAGSPVGSTQAAAPG